METAARQFGLGGRAGTAAVPIPRVDCRANNGSSDNGYRFPAWSVSVGAIPL